MNVSNVSRSNGNGLDDHPDTIMRDVEDDEEERFRERAPLHLSNGNATTAREEERRKVLEIEEERIRLEREAQMRRNGAPGTSGGLAGKGCLNNSFTFTVEFLF